MSWEPLKYEGKNDNRSQLWKRIKKLEKDNQEKNEVIIELQKKVDARSDYEDLLDEIESLKKENANLKRSNTMLKNNQTS
jgi:hypothetical protein